MIVYLRGWKTHGLRCPDMDIDFGERLDRHQISLVQMPNGTGKSTIIELLNACLTGDSLSVDRVLKLQSVTREEAIGRFELNLLVQESAGQKSQRLDIVMTLDFSTGICSYSTFRDPSSGLEQGWRPPLALEPFLNDRCVDVFVFKGDRVDNLLSPARNDAEASIKAFFGISAIEELVADIEREFAGRQYQGGTTDKTVVQRRNVLHRWQDRLDVLQRELKSLEDQRRTIASGYADKREAHRQLMERKTQHFTTLTRLEGEIRAETRALSDASNNALAALRNPLFLSDAMAGSLAGLKSNLDKMKLPGTSIEFFRELTEQPLCVCDREMDEGAQTAVLRNAASYLSDAHVTVVNGIKKDIGTYTAKAEDLRSAKPFEGLGRASSALRTKKQQLTRLNNTIYDDGTEEERAAIERWEEATLKTAENDKAIEDRTGEGDVSVSVATRSNQPENYQSIPLIEKVIRELSRELAVSQNTVREFNAKEKLKSILKNAADKAIVSLSAELTRASNQKLGKILPRGTQLKILSVDKNIRLGFGDIQQDRGSGGQNVAVAYSFATSILEKSGIQFPLIVDHPVTALQESARREMGESLSKICHQFVGFIIDTEKPGFVAALQTSGAHINYITVYRNIEGNKPYDALLPKGPKGVKETRNAIMCTDYEFFAKFQDLGDAADALHDV